MSAAEGPGEFADSNAAARWADIERRADDLVQTLYSLREAVPDDGNRARIEDTLASLQAVRSALDAERTSGGADPRQAEVVRDRLSSFEMSLRALKEGDQEYHWAGQGGCPAPPSGLDLSRSSRPPCALAWMSSGSPRCNSRSRPLPRVSACPRRRSATAIAASAVISDPVVMEPVIYQRALMAAL